MLEEKSLDLFCQEEEKCVKKEKKPAEASSRLHELLSTQDLSLSAGLDVASAIFFYATHSCSLLSLNQVSEGKWRREKAAA